MCNTASKLGKVWKTQMIQAGTSLHAVLLIFTQMNNIIRHRKTQVMS